MVLVKNQKCTCQKSSQTRYVDVVNKQFQLVDANFAIAFTELVRDVPSQGTKFTAFNDGGMKKTQRVQQIFERMWMCGTFKPLVFKRQVGSYQRRTNSFGRFFGNFNGTLQHRYWKFIAGQSSQPQTKFLVGRFR